MDVREMGFGGGGGGIDRIDLAQERDGDGLLWMR